MGEVAMEKIGQKRRGQRMPGKKCKDGILNKVIRKDDV